MSEKVLRIGTAVCRCSNHVIADVHGTPAPSNAEFNRKVIAHAKGEDRHDVLAFIGRGLPEPIISDDAIPTMERVELHELRARLGLPPLPSNETFNALMRVSRS